MKYLYIPIALIAFGACAEEVPPPVYRMVPVTTRDIIVSASAAGSVEPVRTVDVKSKASGEIIEVAVETGDVVRRGERLVLVDPRVPRNALIQAEADLEVGEAQLANAQSQLRRAEELYETQSITEQEYEAARLQSANAKASLVRAERSLEDARIAYEDTDVRAPIAGMIIQRNVEVGTVISSATREVGGGTVLLQMANLDTVQVRSLVDETDIGKIQPGMPVTIVVDAYPNRPFQGHVLKIEPMAQTAQNVTMFPVLVRISNRDGLLRPGMSTEVEVHIGSRERVLAIPNAALRTARDVASAAIVLGLEPETVQQQLARALEERDGGRATLGGTTATDSAPANVFRMQDGREVPLPDGVTADQARAIFQKMRGGGGPQSLSSAERSLLGRLRSAFGGDGGRRRRPRQDNSFQFGGEYVVFVLRDGRPIAVPIRTGLTDLDYSEVRSGLAETDTVLILPSASLIASQEQWRERINRIRGGGIPGIQRQNTSSSSSRGNR
ncbi:MAG: efflux RND transporter periplasmic adaptor subunit [Gemmatimonadetes bacterium]|nr:efflux RND transporter periplasmic adaptor subunit [Gemmatimonadota bacterium]